MYKVLGIKLKGNVALKIHTGEYGGLYFLKPDYLQKIYDYTNATFVETNTAYSPNNHRHNTTIHTKLAEVHGWLKDGRRFLIMDENEKDYEIEIPEHKYLNVNLVGERIKDFESLLIVSHFKGHPMGGFGGALKQLSIGFASRGGKAYIHSGGITKNYKEFYLNKTKFSQYNFTMSMAEAASSIVHYFNNVTKGGSAYINVLKDISLVCDCMGTAPVPKIHDIGILSSTDPVALDQASVDLIRKTKDEGTEEWLKQVEDKIGENTIKECVRLGVGTKDYEIIDLDNVTVTSGL